MLAFQTTLWHNQGNLSKGSVDMKVINVKLAVKPGQQAAYEVFVAQLVEGSRTEAGNVSYDHFKKLDSDTDYEIIEHWRDGAAVDMHNETPHFKAFLAGIGEYVTADPIIYRMTYGE